MSNERQIDLILADDHPVVLHGLAGLLNADPRLGVRAVCSSGSEALDEIRRFSFDVAILDIAMPGLSGLDVARAIAREGLKTHVILLTAAATDRQREEARCLGASLMFKDAAAEDLVGHVIKKMEDHRNRTPSSPTTVARLELTQREREIADLVAKGISNKEIARKLSVSEPTVKSHLHNIFTKTGLASRTALAAYTLTK